MASAAPGMTPASGTAAASGLRYLIGSAGISVAGDWVLLTAGAIVVFRETGSTTAVSLLLGLAAIPVVLLGPFAGVVADRYDRRRIMMIADLVNAAALLLCLMAVAMGYTLPAVYAAVIAVAVVSTFHRPAGEALLPRLAGDEGLARANSAIRLATRLAQIVGPAAASGLITVGGVKLVLAADAATFLVSGGLIVLINSIGPAPGRDGVAHSPFRAAADGITYTRRRMNLRVVIAAIGIVSLAGPVVNAGTITLVSEELHLPDNRYGILLAVEGAGALALAACFLALGQRLRLLAAGAGSLLVTGFSAALLGAAPGMAVASLAMALMGAGVVGMQVGLASYLQQETEDAFRGRVMSLVAMAASFAAVAGFAGAGPLVEAIGVRQAFGLVGIVIIGASLPVVWLAARTAAVQRQPA
ncbi:MAG: hypothetical protein C0506_08660 [Anaerolinea sp.]|nr:hypothetical protein [Anaerolinea sp.]